MASPSERSSSSRSTTTLMPGRLVIACDATKNINAQEFRHIITNIQMRDGMIQEVDTITVLGVLHKVLHPMGFQMQIGPNSFIGTGVRAIKVEVLRMVDAYVGMLQHSAEECEGNGVVIEVKIVVGAPLKKVVAQEVVASNATWVILNRHLKKELKFYLKHIPCKVALTHDNFSLEVLRSYYSEKATANTEHELFYSLSKLVPLLLAEYNMNNEQSVISPSYRGSMSSHESSDSEKSSFVSSVTSKSKEQSLFSPDEFGSNPQLEKSDSYAKDKDKYDNSQPVMQKQSLLSDSDVPFLCTANEMKSELDSKALKYTKIQIATDFFSSGNLLGEDIDAKVDKKSDDSYPIVQEQRNLQLDSHAPPHPSDEMKMRLDSKGYNYSEIQIATNDFSSDNLLGEDGYGVVYKGRLKDGKLIAVKVQKEANAQDNTEHVLEWHRRHAIAIGIAKGLRFLHEECRGSPIIHRDMRPSNIFLTHEFVPLLGDCGLAKWKTNKYDRQTKILGTLEYLAPEYAENGICSVKTDVFAFGIILIQLISGRKGVDSMRDSHHQSLRQWAMPLIQTLALDDLVDPCLGDSYSTYELYQMARVAYLCVQNKSAMRPTMGEEIKFLRHHGSIKARLTFERSPLSSNKKLPPEVLRVLEGKNDHLNHLTEQFIPHRSNVQRPFCLQINSSGLIGETSSLLAELFTDVISNS